MTVENTADNAERCVCPTCPTYDACTRAASELLFCARGKTDCPLSAVSCKCGACTVWHANSLSSYYFCIKGSAQ